MKHKKSKSIHRQRGSYRRAAVPGRRVCAQAKYFDWLSADDCGHKTAALGIE